MRRRALRHRHRDHSGSRAARSAPGTSLPSGRCPPDIPRPPYLRGAGARCVPAFPPDEFADRMRAAGRAAREVLLEVGAAVAPGVTTDELDRICHEACIARGGYPSPLDYKGFPKSLCTSVNEVICHGIPDDRALLDGDIVNCDVTIYLDGVHGDCSATFLVGDVDRSRQRLVQVTRECAVEGHRRGAARAAGSTRSAARSRTHAEADGLRRRAHVRRPRRRARVPHRAVGAALLRPARRHACSSPA